MTQGREKNIFFPKSPQEFFTHQVDRFGKSFGTFFDLNFVPGHIKAAKEDIEKAFQLKAVGWRDV